MKTLEIGSGENPVKEKNSKKINLDIRKTPQTDVVHNLNNFPYPFKDHSFDEVIANHVLEHLKRGSIYKVFKELYRICKDDAIINIETPFFSSSLQHTTLDHRIFFGYTTLDFLEAKHPSHHIHAKNTNFSIETKKIIFGSNRKTRWLNKIINPIINRMPRFYQRFLCWTIPSEVIRFKLKVIK